MSKERDLLERWAYQSGFSEYYILREETETFLSQPESLREDLREDLREGISLRDHFAGLRKEIASLRTANDRQEADLRLAKTALAETMKLFNNQRNDSGLRDHFACAAMQGFIALNAFKMGLIVTMSYDTADLMLAEREKGDG